MKRVILVIILFSILFPTAVLAQDGSQEEYLEHGWNIQKSNYHVVIQHRSGILWEFDLEVMIIDESETYSALLISGINPEGDWVNYLIFSTLEEAYFFDGILTRYIWWHDDFVVHQKNETENTIQILSTTNEFHQGTIVDLGQTWIVENIYLINESERTVLVGFDYHEEGYVGFSQHGAIGWTLKRPIRQYY